MIFDPNKRYLSSGCSSPNLMTEMLLFAFTVSRNMVTENETGELARSFPCIRTGSLGVRLLKNESQNVPDMGRVPA